MKAKLHLSRHRRPPFRRHHHLRYINLHQYLLLDCGSSAIPVGPLVDLCAFQYFLFISHWLLQTKVERLAGRYLGRQDQVVAHHSSRYPGNARCASQLLVRPVSMRRSLRCASRQEQEQQLDHRLKETQIRPLPSQLHLQI